MRDFLTDGVFQRTDSLMTELNCFAYTPYVQRQKEGAAAAHGNFSLGDIVFLLSSAICWGFHFIPGLTASLWLQNLLCDLFFFFLFSFLLSLLIHYVYSVQPREPKWAAFEWIGICLALSLDWSAANSVHQHSGQLLLAFCFCIFMSRASVPACHLWDLSVNFSFLRPKVYWSLARKDYQQYGCPLTVISPLQPTLSCKVV